jgi:hypothetical protein
MKLVLLLIVIVVIGACLGWFHFSSSHDAGRPNVTFSVDRDKIRADKNEVVDKIQGLESRPADGTATTSQKAHD